MRLGGAQLGAARARVACDSRPRRRSPARRQHAHRARFPIEGAQRVLDDAVLERMEGDDDQPGAGAQAQHGVAHELVEASSSPLTQMRSAWKVRVAGSIRW
jgi:hypothetical protein